MKDPEWLTAVRTANGAVLDACHALDAAFPALSEWDFHGEQVIVSTIGACSDQVGLIYVHLAGHPGWLKRVNALELKPIPKEEIPCLDTLTTSPVPVPPAATSTGATSPGR